MIVKDLIEQLQKMSQELQVYYVMFDDGYNIVKLSDKDIIATTLEDDNGKEFKAIVLGEGWLM